MSLRTCYPAHLFITAIILVQFSVQEIQADTISVPQDVGTIQGAISIASDGDEIIVAPGTYHEAIDLEGKAVTLRSSDGPELTTIDASGAPGNSAILMNSGEWLDTVIDGFTITGGTGTAGGGKFHGGGLYARYASPTIKNCIFTGNTADAGGGIATLGSLIEVSNTVFIANESTGGGYFGGAGMHTNGGSPQISNCIFTQNTASGASKGGALGLFLGSPTIVNTLVHNNTARHGGGIMVQKAQATLINVTVANNFAHTTGGGMRALYDTAQAVIENSIFYGNMADVSGDVQIVDEAAAVTTVMNSIIENGWFGEGSNNLDQDPEFADPANEDFRLLPSSPAIDSGDNSVLPTDLEYDLDGNARIFNETVDLGAYENQNPDDPDTQECLADFNQNNEVDFRDQLQLLSHWGSCSGDCMHDLDNDGEVGHSDLTILLSSWGDCPE